jgi:hypothetical protein
MSEPTYTPPDVATELKSACRTAVGDQLRSIIYFDENDHEQLYLREDLAPDDEETVGGFVENERLGFRSQAVYNESALGEYQFTMRAFDHGYLTRVIEGDHGAFVTTDELQMDHFDELAAAVRGVLAGHDSPSED